MENQKYRINLYERVIKAMNLLEDKDGPDHTGIVVWVDCVGKSYNEITTCLTFDRARDYFASRILLSWVEIREVGIAYRKSWGDVGVQYKFYPNKHNDTEKILP